jgi:hypothetical protein
MPAMRSARFFAVSIFVVSACANTPPPHAPKPVISSSVPFEYVTNDWLKVPAKIGDRRTHLLFDTGGGITILSATVCRELKCAPDGTFSGKRMSGQSIEVSMARVPSISIGGHRVSNARVAVLDTSDLLHPDLGVDGICGLDLFRDQAVTIDYAKKQLVMEDAASLEARKKSGVVTKVRVENEGPSTVVYLPLEISPQLPPAEMEVDTGSRDLILDVRFMKELGIPTIGPNVKIVDGKDETSNEYVRYFSKLPRALAVPGAANVSAPAEATVMFQKIIHDGLVGHSFLSAHTAITFDVANGIMIFGG